MPESVKGKSVKVHTSALCRRGEKHNQNQRFLNCRAKHYSVLLHFRDAMLRSGWLCFFS